MSDDRMIEFGAVQHEKDRQKWQGQPHDLVAIDEATEFPYSIVQFLTGWNRTTIANQKCRVIFTFNPPMTESGEWVIEYFAAWLDDKHPNKARDGELRWYATIDDKIVEVESGAPIKSSDGSLIVPKSRTFYHASLVDNPALEESGYAATIDLLPEPLRSTLKGSFSAGKIEDPFQTIPTEWVRLAMDRWTDTIPTGERLDEDNDLSSAPIKMTAIGADVARGGKDKTTIARLHSDYFRELLEYPGTKTPDGRTVAQLIVNAQEDSAPIGVDVIGVGSSVYDVLVDLDQDVTPINFGEGTDETDQSGKLRFANVRALAYWRLREALDPKNEGSIALPKDDRLLSDLCSPRWSIRTGRILIEPKDAVKERIGRSPDKGDAVVLAWYVAQHSGRLFYE
jgi:hypothetical protein